MGKGRDAKDVVLVAVLKSKGDQKILLKKHWYRIPAAFAPKRRFNYIAFYQPVVFGKNGKRILYYGRITKREKIKRIELLPKEPNHPRAQDYYIKFEFSEIFKLSRPIINIVPRRVFFGFATLAKLLSSRTILELYGVPATEEIIKRGLDQLGISHQREYTISKSGKRYRVDFAVISSARAIAIECDNQKAHSNKSQIKHDKRKDAFLRRLGWRVLRFKEKDIIERLDWCLGKIEATIRNLKTLK